MATKHSNNTHKQSTGTQNTALRITTGCTQTTPIPHLHRETSTPSPATHAYERNTHIHINRLPNPLHHLRSAPVRKQKARPPRKTVAKLYQQESDALPPIPDSTSRRTHTHRLH